MLALLNNTAVVHFECQEYDDAQETFGRLAYLAASSTSLFFKNDELSPPESSDESSVDESLLFKVNSMVLNASVGLMSASLTAVAA